MKIPSPLEPLLPSLTNDSPNTPIVERYGLFPYADALAYQRQIRNEVILNSGAERLIFLEHPPTVTWGRRTDDQEVLDGKIHLQSLESPIQRNVQLKAGEMEVAFVPVERGGQATYHAPGQLVVYPIVHLPRRGWSVRDYLQKLQRTVIEVLSHLGLDCRCGDDEAGIWIEDRKIASFGIHLRRGVTIHGLAVNLDVDLDGFGLIRPCGHDPSSMTSASAELGRIVTRQELEPVMLREVVNMVVL